MAVRTDRLRRRHRRVRLQVLAICAALLAGSAVAEDPEALRRRGREQLRAGNPAAAADAFRDALQALPDDADLLLDLGRSHSALKDWEAAIRSYRRVIELRPDDAKALNNLANVYFRQGLYEQAADGYRRAVAIRPDYLLAQFHLGWVERQLNRPEAARSAFTACLQLPADDDRERRTQLDCHFYLGTMAYREGDPAAAARVMEQVLSVQPYHAEARHYLAMAYRRLGRDQEARAQFEIHRQILAANRSQPIEAGVDEP